MRRDKPQLTTKYIKINGRILEVTSIECNAIKERVNPVYAVMLL
jgi:hypothetical protein